MVTIMKRGMNCHKALDGIMSNAHFGVMHIVDKVGKKHEVPPACIKADGMLKKNWKRIFQQQTGYAIPA